MKSVLVNYVTDKAEEIIDAIDAYLENNKHSAFGTIEERRRWFIDRIELDSKRYEIASVIYSNCGLTAPYEQILESLRIIERDAESTEEFNKIKQKLRRLLSEIHLNQNSCAEDSDEAEKLEDFLEDRSERGWEYDDKEEEAIDFLADYDADDYDTSGCEAEIASILGLNYDEDDDFEVYHESDSKPQGPIKSDEELNCPICEWNGNVRKLDNKKYNFSCIACSLVFNKSGEWVESYDLPTCLEPREYPEEWNKAVENFSEPGVKNKEGFFEDNKIHGAVTEWHWNGIKKKLSNYKNGKLHGLWEEWYENGQLKDKGNYKDDEIFGLWSSWYENGQKKFEVIFHSQHHLRSFSNHRHLPITSR